MKQPQSVQIEMRPVFRNRVCDTTADGIARPLDYGDMAAIAEGTGGERRVRMELTRRGKAVIAIAALLVAALFVAVVSPLHSASSSEAPQQVEIRQVQSGDTLWQFAEEITPPGGDVQDSVDRLEELNDMDSATIYAGQRLVLPVQ